MDAEYGLYNYGARLYDPIIGRFISPDTIVPQPYNPQSLNRYTYCLNNPLIYVDPSGYSYYILPPDPGDDEVLFEIVVWEYRDNPYRDLIGLLAGPIINWLQQQEQIMSYREQWMKENLPGPSQNVPPGGASGGSGGGSGGNPNKPDDQSNEDYNFKIKGNPRGQQGEIRESVNKYCDQVMARITDPELAEGIMNRCRNGIIRCIDCGEGVFGRNWKYPFLNLYSPIAELCVNQSSHPPYGESVIEEWAHSVGWEHWDGAGVPCLDTLECKEIVEWDLE